MSLIKCKECGNEVSSKAETCPKCGAKVQANGIGCGGLIAIVFVIGIIGSLFSGTSNNSTSTSTTSASTSITAQGTTSSNKSESVEDRIKRIQAIKLGKCTPPLKWVKNRIQKNPEWSDVTIAHTTCNSVQIGMSQDQAIAAWGRPNDINRSTYSFGVHEQWVYGEYGDRGYLYFENGTLTSIQN